jgi:glycosyltransferase involved in cell wall biosynthesis
MPTLLQITSALNWGSIGRIAEQVGELAQRRGWKVYFAYGRYANPSALEVIRVGGKLNPYLHYAAHRLLDREGLASCGATRQLIHRIQEIHPDIVHLHDIHDHWLNYKLLFEYLNQTDIKVVWTLHDCWNFTGGCCHYTHLHCNKWQGECSKCPRPGLLRDKSLYQFHLRKSLFTANRFLTLVPVSKWLEGEVRKSFLKDVPIQAILNGVDIDVFHEIKDNRLRQTLHLGGKFILMAAATSWSKQKGLDDYSALSQILPDDCVIVLVGLSPAQIKHLPSNIMGVPRTSNVQELAEYYSMADVVMNLSYEETFGLTTAEGYACGTPAIVYNATASPELVTPETGRVVEPGDIQGVLSAVMEIKEKGKSWYAAACRKRAETWYDKNKNFKQYISLYDSLLTKKV